MVYCFDLDDTICIHKNRDYPNAAPIDEVIAKMKELRRVDPESHIIINTSRGMNSCKGDSRLAEERNRAVIEEWLFKHGVPYDEIVFGKPLADAYIDDKAVPAHRFSSGCVREYKGFSGASVIRVADMVIKGGEKTAFEYEWYSKDRALKFTRHKIPNVFTQTLGKLCLEYVSGTPLYDVVSSSVAGETYIARVRDVLSEFSQCREGGENDVGAYCDLIHEAGQRGATALSTEFFCMEQRSNRLKEQRQLFKDLCGFDLFAFYKKYSVGCGYLRLNKKIKKPFFDKMKAVCDEYNMRFYVSDAHWKDMCHNGSCCGLPEDWNYSRGQFGEALQIAKKNGIVKYSDIREDIDKLLSGFLYKRAESFNTNSCEKRAHFEGMTMADYMRWLRNNPQSGQNIYKMFEGVVCPVGKDENGDLVYKYVGK